MKGQVAIIVLLVSAVMLTLGLTMSKNETTEIKLNTNDELLKKAFDSAESGINFYLGTGGTNYSSPDNNSAALVNATKIGEGSNKIDFGELILAGSSENYWLVNHLANGDIGASFFSGPNIDVCGVGYSGQVSVNLFYKTGVKFNIKRQMINLNTCATVSMIGSPLLLSVVPINGSAKLYIEAKNGGFFSNQGVDVTAEGSSGGTSKKISVRQRYRLPGFLTSGIMAEGSILSD